MFTLQENVTNIVREYFKDKKCFSIEDMFVAKKYIYKLSKSDVIRANPLL